MKLRSLLHCKKNWDFTPYQKWHTSLPLYSWGEELLVGFYRLNENQVTDDQNMHVIDLQHSFDPHNNENPTPTLPVLFKALYPQLSLSEFSRFWQKINRHQEWQPYLKDLMTCFGWRPNHNFEILLECLCATPFSFQKWCFDKQLGPQDLAPLRVFKPSSSLSFESIEPLLIALAQLSPSKSEGVALLEWSIDLFLMNIPICEILPESVLSQSNSWFNHLKKMRFPSSTNTDHQRNEAIGHLPWPRQTHGKWIRQGDQSFLEIKMHLKSRKEFDEKIKQVASLSSQMQQMHQLGNLWNT